MEGTADTDYRHATRVSEEFKTKNLGKFHDLHVQVIHYYLQMYMKTSETNILRYINLILLIFYQHQH